eukprot:11178-Heterococcus_DN1.PRE.1
MASWMQQRLRHITESNAEDAAAAIAADQEVQELSQQWKAKAEQLALDIQSGKVLTLSRQGP